MANNIENTIRAHHLGYMLHLDRGVMQMESEGLNDREARRQAERQFSASMFQMLWDMSTLVETNPESAEYYKDVVGVDRKGIRHIAETFATALIGLYTLSEEELTISSEKDAICHGCAIGNHCDGIEFIHDYQYMRDVMRVADELEIAYTSDNGSLLIPTYDLRRILRHMNENEMGFTYDK